MGLVVPMPRSFMIEYDPSELSPEKEDDQIFMQILHSDAESICYEICDECNMSNDLLQTMVSTNKLLCSHCFTNNQ